MLARVSQIHIRLLDFTVPRHTQTVEKLDKNPSKSPLASTQAGRNVDQRKKSSKVTDSRLFIRKSKGENSMKILVSFVVVSFGLIGTMARAQDTSVNVNTLTAPELAVVPVIDGNLDDPAWAQVPAVRVTGSGDSPAATAPGDLDITMQVAWDKETNALYFAFNVKDDVFVNVLGLGSSVGSSGWQNERMELILNGLNTGEASHGENSEFHTQYTFDLPNTIDDSPVGLADIPVSTEFIAVPVLEGIDGSIIPSVWPFNLNDGYVQSAAMIRVTDPQVDTWMEAPVEWNWEFKIVVYEQLFNASATGIDMADQANIDNGYLDFFEDAVHVIHILRDHDVIGLSPQQNDADEFDIPPTREHQQNTTNRAGNWDSSAELTGLILLPAQVNVADWPIQ